MEEWKEDILFKFVFKKAHGEVAKLYYNYDANQQSKKQPSAYIDTTRVPLPQVLPRGQSLSAVLKKPDPVPQVKEEPPEEPSKPENNAVFSPESKRRAAPVLAGSEERKVASRPPPKRPINTSAPTGGTLRTPPSRPPPSALRPNRPASQNSNTPSSDEPAEKPSTPPNTPPTRPIIQNTPPQKPEPVPPPKPAVAEQVEEEPQDSSKPYLSKSILAFFLWFIFFMVINNFFDKNFRYHRLVN